MNIKQLEKIVLEGYDAGRYSPTGADGGALKYIWVYSGLDILKASITVDTEIASIRRIWELKLNDTPIYDYTKQYYSMR